MLTTAKGARANQTAHVVVVVSGSAHTGEDPAAAANLLKAEGATVLMVAGQEFEDAETDAFQIATTLNHAIIVDTFDGLRDRPIDARVVGHVCETPPPFIPGESMVKSLRTCELEAFQSTCVTPQFVIRGKFDAEDSAFELYTALTGIPSAINHLQSAASTGDVPELIFEHSVQCI